MSGKQSPRVSLIIPTYKREAVLVACLRCALNQTYEPLEILVIDQTESHSRTTAEFIESVGDRVRVIHHSPPCAVTARNCAIHQAVGEILIFIDDDTTFEPDFVRAHVAAHLRGADVVQGRVMEPGRSPSYRAQWVRPWLRVVGSNTYDKTSKTNTVTGCNFSVSRKAVELVGDFDTNFSGTLINEDADYGARCYKAGLQMVFDADAAVLHHREAGGGVDANMKAKLRIFEVSVLRNELYFARKHFPLPVVWIYKWRIARRLRRIRRKTGQTPPIPAGQLLNQADRAARDLLRSGNSP